MASRRQNILKASLSCAISHRIGVWQKRELPSKPETLYEAIGDIPISEITGWIEAVQEAMDQYEAIVDSRTPGTAMKIAYEDWCDLFVWLEARPGEGRYVRQLADEFAL